MAYLGSSEGPGVFGFDKKVILNESAAYRTSSIRLEPEVPMHPVYPERLLLHQSRHGSPLTGPEVQFLR